MNKQKKIKLLLAAYVNYPNAQNVNCDNIAQHLNKDQFDVHVLYMGGYPMDKKRYASMGITAHYINPHRYAHQLTLWKNLLFGGYDIYYIPKSDPIFLRFINRFKHKRLLVSSIESVITQKNMAYMQYIFEDMVDAFSISHCIAESVKRYYNRETVVLPLGVKRLPSVQQVRHQEVKNIIWVGNVKANKRPLLLLQCAQRFPQLSFTVIGDGDMQPAVEEYIAQHTLTNVVLTGRIPNEEVYRYMAQADLLLMTSEFEGLPKVIQEAAQCGVPSIYMANNYTVDFITDGDNGFGVFSVDEMMEKVAMLLAQPAVYQAMSYRAKEGIIEYTWEKLIPRYEAWFMTVLERYKMERQL